MTDATTDIDLMLRFQDGEEEAFDRIVNRHQRSVLNLVRRFVGPGPDNEDLAQEVFVRLYQARRKYKPSAKFTTFLYRNTLNLCLNYIRDSKHRRALSLDRPGADEDVRVDPPDGSAKSPGESAQESERAAAVRAAVLALPENQRIAVVLSRWHGLPYQEIAGTLAVTPMAVKSLLNRAKENLREKLSVLLKDEEIVRRVQSPADGKPNPVRDGGGSP